MDVKVLILDPTTPRKHYHLQKLLPILFNYLLMLKGAHRYRARNPRKAVVALQQSHPPSQVKSTLDIFLLILHPTTPRNHYLPSSKTTTHILQLPTNPQRRAPLPREKPPQALATFTKRHSLCSAPISANNTTQSILHHHRPLTTTILMNYYPYCSTTY